MSTNGHLLFSISSLILAKKLAITNEFVNGDYIYLIIGTLIGAIFPDIDHPSSKFGKLFYLLSLPIYKIFGHRGFTHSLTAWLIIVYFFKKIKNIFLISKELTHGFLLGYLSHLIADMLTFKGIPLFWPYKTYFSIPILKDNLNDKKEKIISIIFIIFSLFIKINHKNIIFFFLK